MQKLNFRNYVFRFRNSGRVTIFDEIRKKFLVLTPEEWVRQHVVHYALLDQKYPRSLVNVEKVLRVNDLQKRYDLVVYKPDGSIFLLVECKAPQVPITQAVFDQIARYNLSLNAEVLMVTNGLHHYFCKLDYQNQRYEFLEQLPPYPQKQTP